MDFYFEKQHIKNLFDEERDDSGLVEVQRSIIGGDMDHGTCEEELVFQIDGYDEFYKVSHEWNYSWDTLDDEGDQVKAARVYPHKVTTIEYQ